MKLLPFALSTTLALPLLSVVLLAAEPMSDPLPAGALARFGSFRARSPAHNHPRAACDPAHKLLATGGFDDTVFLFDLATGKRLRTISIDDQSAGPMALAPDAKSLVVECRADLCIFDVATGKEKARLTGHGSRIDGLAFSPDGKWLASCCGKEDIRVWDTATGKLHRRIKCPDSYLRFLTFGPDNRTLGVLADMDTHEVVRCWDAVTGEAKALISPRMRAGSLAFSPDGRALAVVGDTYVSWIL